MTGGRAQTPPFFRAADGALRVMVGTRSLSMDQEARRVGSLSPFAKTIARPLTPPAGGEAVERRRRVSRARGPLSNFTVRQQP
jgi:hypothetical protein